MKTFKAEEQLNKIRHNDNQPINYESESFDVEILISMETVRVLLGEMIFHCFVSQIDIPFKKGKTSVTFTPIKRLR